MIARPAAAMALALLLAGGLFVPTAPLHSLVPTTPLMPPSVLHPFGVDDLGRDLFAAVRLGLGTSFRVAGTATIIAVALGVAVGIGAGFGPRWIDIVLSRFGDVVASLPSLIIAILAAALFGGSWLAVAVTLGLTRWPLGARLVRAETKALARRDFVLSARALGGSDVRIALHHIAPHAMTVALTAAGAIFAGALIAEATLAFLGLGDPTRASLGTLAANGFSFFSIAPWMWAAPVISIMVLAALTGAVLDAMARSLRQRPRPPAERPWR